MPNSAGQWPPLLQACKVVGGSTGGDVVLVRLLRSTSALVCFAHFDCAWRPHSLPSLPLCGKYHFSTFFGVTMPGGCCLQGCHGYPTFSALVLVAQTSFQAPFPSSSTVDEFKFI